MGRISARVGPLEIIKLKKEKRRLAKLPADGRWVAIVRIRGTVNVRKDVNDTLNMLRLHKPHHVVIMPFTDTYKGMIMKVHRYIAWGEIDFDTFLDLLRKRGRVGGNKRLTDDLVRKYTREKFASIEDLAKALWNRKVRFKDLEWLKPVFRLHPPRGGYRGTIKKPFELGGSFGYWGARINELVRKMM